MPNLNYAHEGRTNTRLNRLERSGTADYLQTPAVPTGMSVEWVSDNGGNGVVATFNPVSYDTKGAPITIDRNELATRLAPSVLQPLAGSSMSRREIAASGDFSVITQVGYDTSGPASLWGDCFRVSEDAGETWRDIGDISGRPLTDLKISEDGQTITMLTHGIRQSIDGGATWSLLGTPIYGWNTFTSNLSVSLDGTQLTAQSVGVFRSSSNGGASWTSGFTPGVGGDRLMMGSSSDGRVVAATVQDVFHTETPYVFVTTDYGATWTTHLPESPLPFRDIAVSPDGATIVASTYDFDTVVHDYYTSTDDGASWSVATSGGLEYVNLKMSNDTLFAQGGGYDYALYASEDGGATWSQRAEAMNDSDGWSHLAPSGNGVHFAAYSGHLSTSHDGGLSWATNYQPSVDPNSPPLVSADGTRISVFGFDNTYYSSLDLGLTWRRGGSGNALGAWGTRSFAESGNGELVLAADYWNGQVMYSTDYGETFSAMPNAPTANNNSIITCSADGSLIVMTNNSGIFLMGEFGQPWTPCVGPTGFSSLSASEDGWILVGMTQDSDLYLSTNRGVDWRKMATPSPDPYYNSLQDLVVINADGDQIMLAEYNGGLYVADFPLIGDPAWRSLTSGPGNQGVIEYWPVPNGIWEFRVRAVSVAGIAGGYSELFTIALLPQIS